MKKFWKRLISRIRRKPEARPEDERLPQPLSGVDAIVIPNEITDRHGTGVMLRRIFGQHPNLLVIRSSNFYREHSMVTPKLLVTYGKMNREQSRGRLLEALNGTTVARVVCVPYHADDLVTALLLKEFFHAPLCTYLMDDNNVFSQGIPDVLMAEALRQSDLRLAISPEIRGEYERKYGFKFWVVPPIVSAETVRTQPKPAKGELLAKQTGVLVGNVWSGKWLELLRRTVKNAGLQVHWYGNTCPAWLKVTSAELAQDGIIDCGFLPDEAELTRRLLEYPFALILSGTLDERDDRPEMARLSLPSRMVYLLAAANLPMLVMGSPDTGAARFARRLGVGSVCGYDAAELLRVTQELCQPKTQESLRLQAARHAPVFSAEGIDTWLWQSLAKGAAVDNRFEAHFIREAGEAAIH